MTEMIKKSEYLDHDKYKSSLAETRLTAQI